MSTTAGDEMALGFQGLIVGSLLLGVSGDNDILDMNIWVLYPRFEWIGPGIEGVLGLAL